MNIVLEAGGEDLHDDGDNWEILTEPSAYEAVLEAVKKAGIEPASASVAMIPQNYIKLEGTSREHHDSPDGSARRSGRRAERSFQLRHRRKVAGRSGWMTSASKIIQPPRVGGFLFAALKYFSMNQSFQHISA